MELPDPIKMLLDWLEKSRFWPVLQPFIIAVFTYLAVLVLTYEFIQWQYDLSPSPRLFLTSYYFARVTVVFLGIAAVLGLFMLRFGRKERAIPGRVVRAIREHQGIIAFRLLVLCLIGAGVIAGFRHYSPRKVSHIRIKFLNQPRDFSIDAFAYLIYELNRQQESWYFDVDLDVFKPASLTSAEKSRCDDDERKQLCFAEIEAAGQPLIGITNQPLGPAYFCEHRNNVSVITTADKAYEPLSSYEYLMHCVIVQSILLHLDAEGGGLPAGMFEPGSRTHGGVFQFNPRKEALKSSILAAHLSPTEQELLFNRFGAKYMSVCSSLLTLDWLHSPRIAANLDRTLGLPARTPETSSSVEDTDEHAEGG